MVYAIISALFFGVSAPLSKLLLASVDPIALAGLLYLGAGASLGVLALVSRGRALSRREAGLERQDVPWLAGAIAAGGVAAPIFLLLGLSSTPAAAASLLLNFEVVATALLAYALFGEAVGRRTWIAVAAVSAGGALLSVDPSAGWGLSPGALLIVAASRAVGARQQPHPPDLASRPKALHHGQGARRRRLLARARRRSRTSPAVDLGGPGRLGRRGGLLRGEQRSSSARCAT